jgi:parallel beta-helix repeat protein
MSRCELSGNYASDAGGGIFSIVNGMITLKNCTLSYNRSPEGGGIQMWDSDLTLINTIISFSTQGEAIDVVNNPDIYIYYSDIFGNAGGDYTPYIADYLGSMGNVRLDPLFMNPECGDYRLQSISPCIDTGDPQSPEDPDGTRADMGAYYYNQMTDVEGVPTIPSAFRLNQNYPNPFNARTVISFELAQPSHIRLAVYDLMGREIALLIDGNCNVGEQNIKFDASTLGSGVYFYRLQAGDAIETGRMVLLK